MKIATLNDKARKWVDCPTMLTIMVQVLTNEDRAQLLKLVRDFDAFDPAGQEDGNDPHGEHDFGAIQFQGETYFWKIDYYSKDMQFGSEDPTDPTKTTRVLTIMHASEY